MIKGACILEFASVKYDQIKKEYLPNQILFLPEKTTRSDPSLSGSFSISS